MPESERETGPVVPPPKPPPMRVLPIMFWVYAVPLVLVTDEVPELERE